MRQETAKLIASREYRKLGKEAMPDNQKLQICASNQNFAVIFKPALHDQLGRRVLYPRTMGSKRRQRVIIVGAEMIPQGLD